MVSKLSDPYNEKAFRNLFKSANNSLQDKELKEVFDRSLTEFSNPKYIKGKSQMVPVVCGLAGFGLLGYELSQYLKR